MTLVNRLKTYLSYIILCTFPITTIITYGSGSKLNVSIADLFILLLGVLYLIDFKNFNLQRNFPFAWYFISLVFLTLLSGFINMHTEILSVGYTGLLVEAVKISVSGAYMFTAYNAINFPAHSPLISPGGISDGNYNNNTEYGCSNMQGVAYCWLIGLYICIIYGLYAHIGTISGHSVTLITVPLSGHERFLGTQTDPNAAAFYLCTSFFMVLLAGLGIFKTQRQRIFLLITDILVFICIVLTLSRGGWIGFVTGCVLMAGLCLLKVKKNIIKKLMYAIPILIVSISLLALIDNTFMSGYLRRNIVQRTDVFFSGGGTFESRINLSRASLKMGLDNPIIGVGRGNFGLNSKDYLLDLNVDWEKDKALYDHLVSHNTLAGIFVELGIVGISVFVSIFIIMIAGIIKSKHINFYVKVIIFALWLSVFVQSLALSLENTRALWILAGLFLKLSAQVNTHEEVQS